MRNLQAIFWETINSRESADVILQLVEIAHPTISTIRLCNDRQDVTHDGNVYRNFGFQFALPADQPNAVQTATITFDNTDLTILAALQSIGSGGDDLTVSLTWIRLSDADTPQIGPLEYLCRHYTWNNDQIKADLMINYPFDEPIPGDNMTPDKFPGMFGS